MDENIENKNNKIIDVDYKNISIENNNLNPLYYSTSQVAQILGVTDSTIRFWSNKLESKMTIERNGTHRQFTKENINILKRFQKLIIEKGFKIAQAVEYCVETDDKKIETQIEQHQPLAIEAWSSGIVTELGACLEDFKISVAEDIKQSLQKDLSNIIQQQKDIQEKTTNEILEIKKKQESILLELQETKKDIDMSLKMKQELEKREEEYNQNKKKSFWNKWFKK